MQRIVLMSMILTLIASIGVCGATIHAVTGTSLAISIWQSTPKIYSDTTKWGGIGLDVALGILTVSMSATITDFETLTITSNPSFGLGGSVGFARFGPIQADLGVGLMVTPSMDFMTISTGVSLSYYLFTNTRLHISLGAQTALPWVTPQGSTVNIGCGFDYLIPLL